MEFMVKIKKRLPSVIPANDIPNSSRSYTNPYIRILFYTRICEHSVESIELMTSQKPST